MLGALAAIAGGVLSFAGGAAVAVSSFATSVLSGAAGVVSGTGAALFGGGLTVAQKMGSIAEPGYYDSGVLGSLPAAAASTVDYLGNLAPKAAGIYQMISPPKKAEVPTAARAIPTVPTLSTPLIAKSSLPIFSQQPATMTIGAAAKPEAPNYMLYIGLAVLALFLLRKK